MATIIRRLSHKVTVSARHVQCMRTVKTHANQGSLREGRSTYLCGVAAATSVYLGWRWLQGSAVVEAANPARRPIDEASLRGLKLNHRERRFIKFSSVEHQGQLYMTPQDFIESVTDSEPRPRLKRRLLIEKDLEQFTQETPALAKGSPNMFRTIFDKGIISYTEYLFLLSILTKPQTGFRIAFNMFDTDGNQRVDKEEFLVLMDMITAGVFRAYASWVSDTAQGENPDLEEVKNLQSTRQVVSQLLVGRSVVNVRVGVIYIDRTVVCVAQLAPCSILRLLLSLSGCPDVPCAKCQDAA